MDVRNAIGMLQVGEQVRVDVLHKGEAETRTAKIAAPRRVMADGREVHPKLAGTMLRNLDASEGEQGVLIDKIHTASAAYQAGMRPGDVIVMANRRPVRNLTELEQAATGGGQLLLNIERDGGGFFLLLR